MEYSLLLVIVILSPIKGLDATVPRSVEETPPYGSVGSCYTWGRGAFRTFQDDFFYFNSECNFILSRQCKGPAEDFNIQIQRGSNGNLERIHMLIEGISIITENQIVRVKDVVIKVPYDDKIITIQKYGIYTRISNRKHTISLIWNHHDSLSITLDTIYKNQTCGLCGSFQEGTGINTDSEQAVYNIMVANQLDVLGHVCITDEPTGARGSTCTAANSCISPISMYFSTCLTSPVFMSKYLKMCQRDVCACGSKEECACATFEELSRQCTNLPVMSDDYDDDFGVSWEEWRSKVSCASPNCPENQSYKECGAMCLPTCSDPETQQQCDQCVNACECPKGTVLDDRRDTGRCVDKTACPCEYGGMIYDPEQTRNTSCQSCVCRSGMWECLDISCPGRCKIEEGTHFTTFDNKYYTLKGDCTYFAVVTNSWVVNIELRPCQIAFKQTCLQRVMLINNQTWCTFTNDGNVYSEGNKVGLPFSRGDIMIFRQSSMFLQVAMNSGMKMQVQISPIMQLYISLPEAAQGSTKGLCGTFNDNANDDFLSAYNIVEEAPLAFANSWKVESDCSETENPPPCVSLENEHYAKQHCSYLKDPVGAFATCHSTVDYMKYYQMCVAATCACENINDCLCAGLGAYVHECAAHGIILRNWRENICNVSCSKSQVFEDDMRMCNRTCPSLSDSDYTCSVQDVPVYGCGCPEGKYMDGNGVCVDSSECPCYNEGWLIEKGQSINMHGMPCICQDGKLHCIKATDPDPPDCSHGKVFIDCTNETASSSPRLCERTCRDLNTPCSPCVPDCVCPGGLVEDNDGNCVTREHCPCVFSGEVYSDGTIIQRDCNKCTCQKGSWICTNRECPKTCEVYGDGHYITFDGKRYVYDGNCEYIFVEDQCNRREVTLQILTESVPCCERGMTCSRNIRILLEGKELILTDSHVETVEKLTNQTSCADNFYSRHTVGLYLILTFSNGITVIWDKSTRLSITLDSRWKNKVCGLCGNFNDDVSDDLTTKGNSLVTSAVEFGNSWKSMTCSDTVNQTSPCDRNPYCLAWAHRKCGIIKHAIFQSCHKKVDPTPFYEACTQEACACDLEGKYLGFCTAVAVYAEACNKAGICVDWRTPERCPVYCDYYNTPGEWSWHYQPCGTLTTKTCSDHYIGKKYSAILEGCYPKCPENAPYLDENRMKCVNLSECTCYYNGEILAAGEQSSDCRNCVCTDGNVHCIDVSSTTKATSVTGSSTTEVSLTTKMPTVTSSSTTESYCDGEWSPWFNENTPTIQNRADTELLNQMHRPLCPFSPYQITAISCEALKYPRIPINEMKDNVTCDKEIGLVCTFNLQNSEDDLMCLDYRIKVCCQRLLINTSSTTQTSTTMQTTPTTTFTTEQTTPTTTFTTEQTTPTTTFTTEQTTPAPTTTLTTEQTTPTTTFTTEQTTPTTTVTTEQTTPTTTFTTEQTTPAPTTTLTTEQTTPTTTFTTEQTTPTTTVTTEQTTPTTTFTTEQTTPTTIVTTEQTTPAPTTTLTTEQTTPTTTFTTEQTTPTTIVTTEQTTPAPTTTLTTEQTTPTTTFTTEQTTPTTTFTTEQTTPTTTFTTEQTTPAPTTTLTTEQTTPTTTFTTEQTTPTTTVTTEQTTPTTTFTTEQTTPTTIVTTEQTTPAPTTTLTTEQTTPTTTFTTEQTTPTTIVTTEQTTPAPTTTLTTEQTTPTTTFTTEQTTPTTIVTTEQTTPTTTLTTEQTTPTTTFTTEQTTPTTIVTTEQTTPTTTFTTEQTTPTTTTELTTEQTTPTTEFTTEQTRTTSTFATERTTPITTTTFTTEQTRTTSTFTTEQTVPTTTFTTEWPTPATTFTTEQTTPTPELTTEQTRTTSTFTTEQTVPTTTFTTERSTSTTVTEQTTTACLPDPKPLCLKPYKIMDENGCEKWDCYCQCQVWGDPHYLTFGGTQYDFFDNCTYTLVEERIPKYNFSVLVDNYYCFSDLPMSCARGITMFYNESVVTITTGYQQSITINGDVVTVPYSLNGINIHSMHQKIYISVPDIQANIIAFSDSFRIKLSEKYFLNNTQGQCGSCNSSMSSDCARRNGEIVPPDCCHIAAHDWKVFDPKKPYCQLTPTNQPCILNPSTTVSPTCHPGDTLCELLIGNVFEDCRKQNQEDIERFYKSCAFDYCHTHTTKFVCSSLQASVTACNDKGICIDWRNFTKGHCNYTCPEGFVYKPCESQDNDRCENNILIPGQKLYPLSEGCFCPKGMMLSENKNTCVNTCCRDSSGNPKNEGETWFNPNNSCISYACNNSQVVTSELQCCSIANHLRIEQCNQWCRKQSGHCEKLSIYKSITTDNSSCSAKVEMTKCAGNCPGSSEFDTVTNTMINECSCCQPTDTENRTVSLDCGNGVSVPYTYTHIKSCDCIGNSCNNQYYY